ncbi:hypothetical protein DM860_011070 [Cuscuta australis]|uniref:Helicase ATP-binding domain-containing protein n=1 Tax=Cuscuta australis TaxID=267555 RepID=A0A328E4E6_9ASTE|nr:hypothetical protein DM860_011070 [Cuscuta australis]
MAEHSEEEEEKSFKELGACHNLGWKTASKIQAEVIPHALEGRDIIGVAHTGSGKTGAFAIPILQALLASSKPSPADPTTLLLPALFACVLSPTRELAVQISQQFNALGAGIGAKCVALVGGIDKVRQSILLANRPNILVATPGRLLDHLSDTKVFSFHSLKCLVLDEADKLLNADFEKALDKLLGYISRERTYLFSATMSKKVSELQRACLKNPVKIEKRLDKELPKYPAQEEDVLLLLDRVTEAKRISRVRKKWEATRKEEAVMTRKTMMRIIIRVDAVVTQVNPTPTDYPTIQAALDAAAAARGTGTQFGIHVTAGTYKENVTVRSNNVTLVGDGIGKTIITGNRSAKGGFKTSDSA